MKKSISKSKLTKTDSSDNKEKKKYKFEMITQEEHDRLRVKIYDYII